MSCRLSPSLCLLARRLWLKSVEVLKLEVCWWACGRRSQRKCWVEVVQYECKPLCRIKWEEAFVCEGALVRESASVRESALVREWVGPAVRLVVDRFLKVEGLMTSLLLLGVTQVRLCRPGLGISTEHSSPGAVRDYGCS